MNAAPHLPNAACCGQLYVPAASSSMAVSTGPLPPCILQPSPGAAASKQPQKGTGTPGTTSVQMQLSCRSLHPATAVGTCIEGRSQWPHCRKQGSWVKGIKVARCHTSGGPAWEALTHVQATTKTRTGFISGARPLATLNRVFQGFEWGSSSCRKQTKQQQIAGHSCCSHQNAAGANMKHTQARG